MNWTRSVLIFVIAATFHSSSVESSVKWNRTVECQGEPVSQGVGTVYKGEVAPRGSWPWLAALFIKDDQTFFCSGSLISERFVLSAAHCFLYKGDIEAMKPENVTIYLGKWNISDHNEKKFVVATPNEIFIHRNWDSASSRWDADIAVIRLTSDVPVSNSIRPVCLWTSNLTPAKKNDGGYVVGWGATEDHVNGGHSDVPRQARLKIHPIADCYETDGVRDIISRRGICVGGDGVGPCFGDSGGGLFTALNNKWILRGVTSSSLTDSFMMCDVYKQSVFTSVQEFSGWIEKILDGGDKMRCKFMRFQYGVTGHSKTFYGQMCQLRNSPIFHDDYEFVGITGGHRDNFVPEDVKKFDISYQKKVKYLPIKVGEFFSNLSHYTSEGCEVETIARKNFQDLPTLKSLNIEGLLKEISRDAFYDLIELTDLWLNRNRIEKFDRLLLIHNPNLKNFGLAWNKIKSLHGSTFSRNLKLEWINLAHNSLLFIGSELFLPLEMLETADFTNNSCVDVGFGDSYWIHHHASKKQTVEMIMKQCQSTLLD